MKNIILTIIFLSSVSQKSIANEAVATALAASAATGALFALNEIQYQNWIKSDLEDWKDPETGTSIRLNNSCGFLIESRIYGNRRTNQVFFALSNKKSESIIIKPQNIKVIYSTGRERFAQFPFQIDDLEIKSGWWGRGIVSLPRKSDIKNADYIDIEIPYYKRNGEQSECIVRNRLLRNKNLPQSPNSYERSTYFDFAIMFGANTLSTGDTENIISTGDTATNIQWNIYFLPHMGLSFGVSIGSTGSKEENLVRSQSGREYVDTSISSGFFGLSGIREITEKRNLTWGAGVHFFSLDDNDAYKNDLDSDIVSGTSYYFSIGYEWVFSRVDYGFWMGDYSLGLNFTHFGVPSKKVGNLEIGGSYNPLYLSFRMGF